MGVRGTAVADLMKLIHRALALAALAALGVACYRAGWEQGAIACACLVGIGAAPWFLTT